MEFFKELFLIAVLCVIYIETLPPCSDCPPGTYYFPFLGCTDCRKGNYCPGGCFIEYECRDGTFATDERSVKCTDCPAGYECSHKDQDPNECPLGQYSPAKSMSCLECPKDDFCLEPQFHFGPNPPTSRHRNAVHRMAQIAADTYHYNYNNATAETTPFWDYFSHGFISYLAKFNAIVVAFRGSVTWTDWVVDFTIPQQKWGSCEGCKVHIGYSDAYVSIKGQIIPVVYNYVKKWPNAALYVTGHSMGGAQATMCATNLAELGLRPHLITFGSPRVGNPAFADYVNKVIGPTRFNTRVTYRRDEFSSLPPRYVPLIFTHSDYKHVGTEVHYEDLHRALVLPEYLDLWYMHRTVRADHSIQHYKKLR